MRTFKQYLKEDVISDLKAILKAIKDGTDSLSYGELVFLQDHQKEIKKYFPNEPELWEVAGIPEKEYRKANESAGDPFAAKDMKVGDKFFEKGIGQKFTVKRVTPDMIYADSEDGKINLQIDRSENDNDGNNRTDSHAHYLKVNESVFEVVDGGSGKTYFTAEDENHAKEWAKDNVNKLRRPLKVVSDYKKYAEYEPKQIIKESVGQLINITLVRKASNYEAMEQDMRDGWGERVRAKVEEVKKLSTSEYDKLCKNFFAHISWLDGKGGTALPEHVVSVIEVQAPGRKTLYIDPEGFDYARYVGY